MKPVNVGIVSLGCPRNLVDAERILGRLSAKGCRVVDMEKAEIAIVNTCAFVEDAKKESVDVILDLIELKKEGKLRKILVYGCLPQRYKDVLRKELPEVDAFVGALSPLPAQHGDERFPITPAHYAYLKICEGCVNACSFCVIPRIKGKLSSVRIEDCLKQAAAFDTQGVSELNIVGQDITGFGIDRYGKPCLARLVRGILRAAPGIGWIRLLYLHPARITDELLSVIRDNPRICRYIDVPVQHINGRILKLMNRRTGSYALLKLIEKIRRAIPGVVLRTSVITGFPSETEPESRELLSFIRDVRFERLGAFIYSREEDTPAYGLRGQVSRAVKEKRFDRIMSVQQEVSREVNRRFLHTTMDVLIDEKGDGSYLGRTAYDAPEVDGTVYVHSRRKLFPGDFVKVDITDTLEYDLVGKVHS